jgi:hypothetical protein
LISSHVRAAVGRTAMKSSREGGYDVDLRQGRHTS